MSVRTHIKADKSWIHVDWMEVWEYRDLLWFMVFRNFTAIYKQSILGPLWFIITPLASTIVFTVVFGNIARISTDGIPPFLFYFSGMVLWNYFQGLLNDIGNSLITNAGMLGKVYIPRIVIPLSMVVSNLGQLLLNLLMFLGFYAYYLMKDTGHIHPSAWMCLFPLLVLQTAVVGLGVGLWLSAMTVKYRDLRFAMPFLAQLWFFATPVVYPLSGIVARKWTLLMALNPMAALVELTRFMFLGVGKADVEFVSVGIISGMVILLTGLVTFNRVQRTFVDTI